MLFRLTTLAERPPITFRNPIDVAIGRAAELRLRHRRTQLFEYGQLFERTLGPVIKEWLGNAPPHLGKSFIGGQMSNHDINKPLPDGMETMWFEGNTQSVLFAVTVGYYGHPTTWLFVARTAIRGDEGVLLGLITRSTTAPDFSPPWQELMLFNPAELPTAEEFVKHFDECLSRAIDELSDDVERA